MRYVRRGATHIEADDFRHAGLGGRHRSADDATGRPGEDRILSLKEGGIGEAAGGLHEKEPRCRIVLADLGRDMLDIAPQQRREIGIDDGRVAPCDEFDERTCAVACRNLREAQIACDLLRRFFMCGIAVAMHEADRNGADTLIITGLERIAKTVLVEGGQHLTLRAHALIHLSYTGIEKLGLFDFQPEEVRPGLVADCKRIAKAARCQKERAFSLALQQRIGRHGRAHLDRADAIAEEGRAGFDAEQVADALQGGIVVVLGIFGQELARNEAAIRCHTDDVREGAATVDPEVPAAGVRLRCCHAVQPATGPRKQKECRKPGEGLWFPVSARVPVHFADAKPNKIF